MTKEKTPEQIAEQIIDDHTDLLTSKEKGMKWPQKGEYLKDRIATAIRHEREQRVIWPSEKDLEKEYFYNENIHMSEWLTAISTYNWLKSKVKVFEIPEFTDEEIELFCFENYKDKYVKDYQIIIGDRFKSFRYQVEYKMFSIGFNKCLELIKQKLGG